MNTESQAMKVSYDSTTGIKLGDTPLTAGSWQDTLSCYYQPYYQPINVWPTIAYDRTVYRESKFDVAFKIVEKLMDKGHIKELTVKEFTKLVKEIAATL